MLSDNLKILLASTQSFAIKSQNFHWNIEGSNFPQYHEFFNTLYEDVYDTGDKIAEYIRMIGSYTPGSIQRYAELTIIQDQIKIPRAELMFAETLQDCEKMIQLVIEINDLAEQEKQYGVSSYMNDLQDLYGKQAWMIRSILKRDRE